MKAWWISLPVDTNYQLLFSLFVFEKEGNAFGILIAKHGDHHWPIEYWSQQLEPVAGYLPCLGAILPAKIVLGFPWTILMPHTLGVLLSSQPTQRLSSSHLTSHEICLLLFLILFFLIVIISILLPSSMEDTFHDCLTLTHPLLKFHDDLQETPLDNADSSWFTNGSYLKGEHDQYTAMLLQLFEGNNFALSCFGTTGWIVCSCLGLYFSQGRSYKYLYWQLAYPWSRLWFWSAMERERLPHFQRWLN